MSTTKYGSYMSTSGASNFIRPYITYTITSTDTSYTCTWTGGCNVKTNYHTSAKITLKSTATGMSSQSKTVDDKNWGGGNHSMLSGTYTWSRTTSAATKTIKLTMSTNVDSSSVSLSITVNALPTVTITYNGNGGTYSGSSTTLYYGVAGKITSTVPTRPYYTFLGWGTSSSATSATYASGASITRTANLPLYAVWKSTYVAPTVNGEATIYRVANDATGQNPTLANNGTRAYIEFTTTAGTNVNDHNKSHAVYIDGSSTATTLTNELDYSYDSTTGYYTYYGYIGSTSGGSFDLNTTYTIKIVVTVEDINSEEHTISAGSFLSAEVYMMDLSADGKRVAFGQLASDSAEDNIKNRWYAGHPRVISETTLGYTSSTQYLELNQHQIFSQDFVMRADFTPQTDSVRYCLISAYSTTSPQYPCISVELTSGLQLRLYCMDDSGAVTNMSNLGTAISTSETDMSTVVVFWDASEGKITWLLVSGDNHETGSFKPSGTFTGTSPYPVRLGCDTRVNGEPAWGLLTQMDQPAIWYSSIPETYNCLCYWDLTENNNAPYDVGEVICVSNFDSKSNRDFTVEVNGGLACGNGIMSGVSYQSVFGRYNALDTSSIFVIGNGTSDKERITAFHVAQNGRSVVTGNGYTNDQTSILLRTRDINNGTISNVMYMGLGSGGSNHGVFSYFSNKNNATASGWMIHCRTDVPYVYLPKAYDNTTTSAANVNISNYLNGSATQAGCLRRYSSSSRRYKTNIEDIENAEALYDIPVHQFKYKDGYLSEGDLREGKIIPGFVAEEVEEVYPIAVDYESGMVEDWNARYIIPPMLKLIQNQKSEIDTLRKEIDILKAKMET